VLFVEDVVTTGNSLLNAIKTIFDQTENNRVVVIMDRDQGAVEKFRVYDIKIDRAITINQTIEILKKNKRISDSDYHMFKDEMVKT